VSLLVILSISHGDEGDNCCWVEVNTYVLKELALEKGAGMGDRVMGIRV
jgi:hypothetical protein